MPKPSTPTSLYNNYLGGLPGGFDDRLYDWRADYDLSSRQRISTVGVNGARIYLTNFSNQMPLPYVMGTYAKIYPQAYIVEHVFTITPNLVNQLKYSFTRFIQPQINATDGVPRSTRHLPLASPTRRRARAAASSRARPSAPPRPSARLTLPGPQMAPQRQPSR